MSGSSAINNNYRGVSVNLPRTSAEADRVLALLRNPPAEQSKGTGGDAAKPKRKKDRKDKKSHRVSARRSSKTNLRADFDC